MPPIAALTCLSGTLPASFPRIGFTPDKLGANLAVWFRADKNVTMSGSNVASVAGISPANGVTLTSLTPSAAYQLSVVPNAQNALPAIARLDAGGDPASWLDTSARVAGAQIAALNFDYNTPFSIVTSFIFKTASAPGSMLFGQFDSATTKGWMFTHQGGKPSFWLLNNFGDFYWTVTSSLAFVDGEAYTLKLVYDGSGAVGGFSLYVNGVLDTAAAKAANSGLGAAHSAKSPAGTPFNVLEPGFANYSRDQLLEVFIASLALSADQIAGAEQYLNGEWAIY